MYTLEWLWNNDRSGLERRFNDGLNGRRTAAVVAATFATAVAAIVTAAAVTATTVVAGGDSEGIPT